MPWSASPAASELPVLAQELEEGLRLGTGGACLGRFLAPATRLLLTRPTKTTETTVESSRSQATSAQFRLSQAQAYAEASQTLSRGDKNA